MELILLLVVGAVGVALFVHRAHREPRRRYAAPISGASTTPGTAVFPHKTPRPEFAPAPTRLPRRFRTGLRGIARNVEKRERSGEITEDYLSFRLEICDEFGNVQRQLPVELKASDIPGRVIRDGDKVIVRGRPNRHGIVVPKAIFDLNTNSIISVQKHGFFWWIFALPLGLLFLSAPFGILVGIFAITEGRQEGVPLVAGSLAAMVVYYWFYIR